LREYALVGGGSKSKLWRQIVCDVLGTDALVLEHSDASLGAAMLAGVGSSVFQSSGEAIKKCVKTKLKFSFNKDNHTQYKSLIREFGKFHRGIQHVYGRLGKEH
jgi:xylulokinase